PLGTALTELPRIPAGSKRIGHDPYAPKRSTWPAILFLLVALGVTGWVLYRTNVLHHLLPGVCPAHHVENELRTADGKSSATVEHGGSPVLVVKNGQSKLLVSDGKGKAMDPIEVVDGNATLAIPATMAPGTLVVSDGPSSVEVTVVAKK